MTAEMSSVSTNVAPSTGVGGAGRGRRTGEMRTGCDAVDFPSSRAVRLAVRAG